MRKAIVAFTKVPEVGKTKTRLTEKRGGILTPQEANALYEALVLDVIDCCLESANGDTEVWICHDLDGDEERFKAFLEQNLKNSGQIAGVFSDQGGSFDECMQYAADYMLKDGAEGRRAEGIIIVGGDLPTMQVSVLRDALDELERLSLSDRSAGSDKGERGEIGPAIVEGACQEGGFSLVGFTYSTPFDFSGVFYNKDALTALDVLVDKADRENIPFGVVETMPDIDIPADLGSMIPVLRAMKLASAHAHSIRLPRRTLAIIDDIGLSSITTLPGK